MRTITYRFNSIHIIKIKTSIADNIKFKTKISLKHLFKTIIHSIILFKKG